MRLPIAVNKVRRQHEEGATEKKKKKSRQDQQRENDGGQEKIPKTALAKHDLATTQIKRQRS